MTTYKNPIVRCALVLVLAAAAIAPAFPQQAQPERLAAKEFVRLIQDLSEEGGYFFSDNFTSSEDSYLTITGRLKELGAAGGAYIGVGPEQNFTYIAKIRPRIAFIVDIRRQAMVQHLMYKAIFQLSPTRAEFISRLLSRPLPGKPPAADAPLDDILSLLARTPADDKFYARNLAEIRKTIQATGFPLSEEDQSGLEYIYRSFRVWGFDIGFEPGTRGGRRGFGGLPNLMRLLAQKDLQGRQGNFLAAAGDYDFVRDMHARNLIIPVVGDFSGKKALASVGAWLRQRKIPVSVFYVSNVEIVLLDWGSIDQFAAFVANVKKLPANDRSLLIRSTFAWYGHPERLPGYQAVSLLQKVSVFLKDWDEGRYRSYQDLINTHYIGPRK